MPTNFVYDGVPLSTPVFPKADKSPVPLSEDPSKWVDLTDWNAFGQALTDIQNWARGAAWYGIASSASIPGHAGVPHILWLRTSDLALMLDNTNIGNAGNRQVFRVVRQVGDTDTITIDASRGFTARANTNYNVQATMGANSTGIGILGCDPASYTTSQFVVKLTAAPAAGDSILFTVQDLS